MGEKGKMTNDFFFVIKFLIELFDPKLSGYIILAHTCKKPFFLKSELESNEVSM